MTVGDLLNKIDVGRRTEISFEVSDVLADTMSSMGLTHEEVLYFILTMAKKCGLLSGRFHLAQSVVCAQILQGVKEERAHREGKQFEPMLCLPESVHVN